MFDKRVHPRSAVSRAYFAAYARVTASLVLSGVTLPPRGNPTHRSLAPLIENHLNGLTKQKAFKVARLVVRLQSLRVFADYGPRDTVDQSHVRQCLGHLTTVFHELKESQL